MSVPRFFCAGHSAMRLPSGAVLIVGGAATTEAVVFEPAARDP